MKRSLALILCVCLCLGLCACRDKTGPEDPSPSPTASPGGEDVKVDFLPDNEIDVVQEIMGYAGEFPLLTVEGRPVSAQVYLYWLGNITSYYEMMLAYSGQAMDLTEELKEGVTWDSQLKQIAYNNTVLMALTDDLAKEYGVSLSVEDVQELASSRAANIQSAGGEEFYAYQLQAMGIDDDTAFQLDKIGTLFGKVRDAYVEQAEVTDQAVAAYVEENDILRAKHILLLTKDMSTGEVYDDDKKAQQKAKADELLAQLREDPTKFDALMNANSEDGGLAQNPDGYTFTAGEMVVPFEEGTRALAYDEISEVIESEFGYHIILRLDPDSDELRQAVAGEEFDDMTQARIDAAKVETTPEYDALTTQDYYPKLVDFQKTLEAPVVDESQASLLPDESEQPSATPSPES